MIYVKQEKLGNYEKIKQLVLKQFQPTPRVLLSQFRKSQKQPNENHVQFASRIEAMFDYYCKLRNVSEFNELCQLIVADQLINSLDQELTSYINIKMCKHWYKPDKLGRELYLFMSSQVSNKITDLNSVKNLNLKGLIPKNINLADDSFYESGPTNYLLGAEVFYELLRSGQIRSENSNLIFQNTAFGFVASGSNSSVDTKGRVHCGLIKGDLKSDFKMFWELKNVEVSRGTYIALKRLNVLWARLIRDPQYLKLYRDFIHEYEQLGHMKEVVTENDNSKSAYYMPHHAIFRPEKSTTKLRVVFNATNTTTFTADVKMMYRMILIHESQQPLFRILWKESPEDPLSREEEKNFPSAAPLLRENFHMDDVFFLCGAASLMEAKALKNQLSGILKNGVIELHKWGSSHPELASNIIGDYEDEETR
ncbi:uncharacterized protein TNCV_2709821 [Trichonephila clavipes]|nr:uncharacterized protein TNCV_2709821 [Trichonephila clavipes]